MTGSWVSQGERARWQRQAVGKLAAILDASPGPPVIAWTVAPTGSVLTGQVSGLAAAARVRKVFGARRLALAQHVPAQVRAADTGFLGQIARRPDPRAGTVCWLSLLMTLMYPIDCRSQARSARTRLRPVSPILERQAASSISATTSRA